MLISKALLLIVLEFWCAGGGPVCNFVSHTYTHTLTRTHLHAHTYTHTTTRTFIASLPWTPNATVCGLP
jgi:hypothetical protein